MMKDLIADGMVLDLNSGIAVVTFNNPASRNSLSNEVLNNLSALLDRLLPDQTIKVLVFTGSEDVFLSGANIAELARLDDQSAKTFSKNGQELFDRLANARQTTIAAINGYCMGGGLDFALACDIRIASSTAVFAHPGARLGIITGWGGTQRLPRLVGPSRALDLFTTARRVKSDEALNWGLITEISDPILPAAMRLAAQLAS